jgi:hypothetical protein
MGHYAFQWEMVIAGPIVIGLWLIADYLDQWSNRGKKKKPKPMQEKKEAKPVRLFRKRKSGFRNMKSNAQRIRERMEREAAANDQAPPPPVSAPPSPRAAPRGQSWARQSGRVPRRLP